MTPEASWSDHAFRTAGKSHANQARSEPHAVLAHNPGLRISNLASDLWSYGDSNSGPLACHQQAAHQPEYVAAGHRPAACMPIRSRPGQLRYFRAVLSGPAAGVRGRCVTSRWTSGDHAFRSAQCAFRCREECALFSKRRGAVHGSSAGRHVIDVFGRSAEALKMVRALLAR
jgi:hypothetical protein